MTKNDWLPEVKATCGKFNNVEFIICIIFLTYKMQESKNKPLKKTRKIDKFSYALFKIQVLLLGLLLLFKT